MAVKANQQYYADGEYIDKQAREFQPTSEFKNKIDSIEEGAQVNVIEDIKVNGESVTVEDKTVELTIPIVIDNLYTVDGVNALSAKQGKILYDLIQNLQSRGRYLSNWNTATGLPVTIPESSPYQYKAGDYFVVSAVAEEGGTNYRPNGSEFIVGQASTTVETDTVKVTDLYLYDGTNWNLLINSAREIPIDPSLSTTSTNPVENRVVTNAINNKQDKLIAGTNIQIDNDGKTISATDTTYTAGANINIDANNEISAVDTTYTAGANVQISNENVISATDTTYTAGTGIDITNGVISNTQTSAEWGNITGTLSNQTDLQSALDNKQDKFHTTSTTAPSNPSEGDEWYDSTNDVLKVYDGSQWNEVGAGNGDMLYADFNWVTKTGTTITLDLNSEITPSVNFTVNAPSTIKDGQMYVLRVNNGATAYTMTLGTGITNPQSVDTTLTANGVDQFVFLAVDGNLELQPTAEAVEQCNTKTFYLSGTSDLTNAQAAYDWYNDGKNPLLMYSSHCYTLDYVSSSQMVFVCSKIWHNHLSSRSLTSQQRIAFDFSSNTVTTISIGEWNALEYLDTSHNYSTPYTPTYAGSPTTKKYVDDRDTYIGTSEPTSNKVEGRLWYDTTNDVLKVYDGTNWNATGKTYIAGDGIDITNDEISIDTDVVQEKLTAGTGIEITGGIVCTTESDRKGPAPSGFHVPSINEWNGVKTIMNSLSLTTGADWRINLHIPFAGLRNYRDANSINQGIDANLWSSSPYGDTGNNACHINLDSSNVYTDRGWSRATGLSIRAFKDTYVAPESNWTVIQGTLGSAGIFWNQSEGLISITDGTTGYTIQDKNLGATSIYNNGDGLTQANMGNMYQWGNNYGFPSSGTITNTSSTKVDASGYGPSTVNGYYESDTFIISNGDNWSSVRNDDLWGNTSNSTHEECVGDPLTISADTAALQEKLTAGSNIQISNNVISATDTTYAAGDGIDITNNEISVDTTVVQEKLTAGEGIEISKGQVCTTESDRKGPAPSGYHIGSSTEWGTVKTIWNTLGGGDYQGNALGVALKLPRGGYRENDNSVVTSSKLGYYWTSSPGLSTYATRFTFGGANPISAEGGTSRAEGLMLRAFKNTPVVPDSTWTKTYGTSIETGGIFRSSSLGLVSLSGDGSTWVTMQDKNIGATTVWNSGDTVTQDNGGNFYQWGNNYGFSLTGSVTTSTTIVDSSSYGPGNYYSSDTFITVSSGTTLDRSITKNDDLWGDTSNSTHEECVERPLTISSTVDGFNPASAGTVGQILTKTSTGYDWGNAQDSVNTKTFYLSGTSDLATAQAAYNWYLAGKNPIIVYDNLAYSLDNLSPSALIFTGNYRTESYNNSYTAIYSPAIQVNFSGDTVTSVLLNSSYERFGVLTTNADYSTPYTPKYNGSPATKKYVDDNAGMKLAPNSPLSPKYHWFGTEAQYQALSQYYTDEANDTVYYTI